jgi:hypothetical protein
MNGPDDSFATPGTLIRMPRGYQTKAEFGTSSVTLGAANIAPAGAGSTRGDERLAIPLDPVEALRALLRVDPDDDPASGENKTAAAPDSAPTTKTG